MGLDPSEAEDHVCPEGAPAWLATMGDLMSNLLVFFVLMLSFANTDKQIFLETMESIQTAFGVIDTNSAQSFNADTLIDWQSKSSTPCEASRMDQASQAPSMDQRIMQQVQQAIAKNGLSRVVEADASERGVIVRVKGNALFTPASDQLLPISFVFLDEIIRITEEFPYELSIEGHTDDSDIDSSRFPTNWHLSTARSISVLRYMVDAGKIDPSRVAVSGFGSTRPLVPNDSPENRAANRRVEFVYKRDPVDDQSSRAQRRAARRAEQSGTRVE
jgi:chemotaxis protein MotB